MHLSPIYCRIWSLTLAFLIAASSVNCQTQGQSDTRLGLLATQIGVQPVPGGIGVPRPNNNNQPNGCYCLPNNQVCPGQVVRPTAPNPPNQQVPGTSGAGIFDVRIINRLPPGGSLSGGRCPKHDDWWCCLGRENPAGNFITNPPAGHNPVVPNPQQIGESCGAPDPRPYRQAIHPEADFGEYPWMVVVLDLQNRYLGGGVLISSDYVLTAPHKIIGQQNIKVRLGEYDVKSPQDHPQFPHLEIRVDNIITHPQFNPQTLANDVALLHLSQPVNTQAYPHIGTACLPEQGQLFYAQSCWVTGWGKDAFEETGSFQAILKEVDVPMVDPFVCQNRLRGSRLGPRFNLDVYSFVCAGGVEGKDACTGDGGAPLVCRDSRGWTVTGLVAWGIGCAEGGLPGVYVNVANYVNFIRQYVRV